MPTMPSTSVERIARHRLPLLLMALGLLLASVRAQAADEPAPVLSADLNGARSAQVFSGWPMLLRVRLIHPQLFDADASPITLASDAGNWTRSLQILVLDANRAAVSWPFTLLNLPASTLRLDAGNLGELYWSVSPDRTVGIAPGAYTISVSWDSRTVTTPLAWSGEIHAVPVDVRIAAEPASLTSDQLERRQRELADYHIALGESAEALTHIDALLQVDPGNIGGLVYRSGILRQLGRTQEALDTTRLAIAQVVARYPEAVEPPRALLAQRSELTQWLLPGRLNSITPVNGGVRLDWNTVAGELYSVESSRDFINWATSATGLLAQTNVLTWSTNQLQDHEFFRIRQ